MPAWAVGVSVAWAPAFGVRTHGGASHPDAPPAPRPLRPGAATAEPRPHLRSNGPNRLFLMSWPTERSTFHLHGLRHFNSSSQNAAPRVTDGAGRFSPLKHRVHSFVIFRACGKDLHPPAPQAPTAPILNFPECPRFKVLMLSLP